MALEERANGWEIPATDFEVLTVTFSGALHLVAYDSGEEYAIRLEGRFALHTPEGNEHRLDAASNWRDLTPVLSLRHARISELFVSREGDLRVALDTGARLEAQPEPAYESWALWGPDAIELICRPGGGDPRRPGARP
ncbi:MAG: hypothetical protein V7607_4853 [Solirubrobacteraceae bacterium]